MPDSKLSRTHCYFNANLPLTLFERPNGQNTVGTINKFTCFNTIATCALDNQLWCQVDHAAAASSGHENSEWWCLVGKSCKLINQPAPALKFYFSTCELAVRRSPHVESAMVRTIPRYSVFMTEERAMHYGIMWLRIVSQSGCIYFNYPVAHLSHHLARSILLPAR